MDWWLNVLFLVNGVWVLGQDIGVAGWSPRHYASEQECMERLAFAERSSRAYPLEYPTEWRCTSPNPLADVPDDLQGVRVAADDVSLGAADDSTPPEMLAECEAESDTTSISYDLITRDEDASIPEGALVLRYRGPIVRATTGILGEARSAAADGFQSLIFDLDSQGGDLDSVRRAVEALRDLRSDLRLVTLVRQGNHCLSGCLPVFMEGEERVAGNASVWMIHGACRSNTNLPSLELTQRYLDMMEGGGVGATFLDELVARGYVLNPGQYWLSGHELHAHEDANVITRLIGPWTPEAVWVR